jgi:hypothetical protein
VCESIKSVHILISGYLTVLTVETREQTVEEAAKGVAGAGSIGVHASAGEEKFDSEFDSEFDSDLRAGES